jgi:hypothetical protein
MQSAPVVARISLATFPLLQRNAALYAGGDVTHASDEVQRSGRQSARLLVSELGPAQVTVGPPRWLSIRKGARRGGCGSISTGHSRYGPPVRQTEPERGHFRARCVRRGRAVRPPLALAALRAGVCTWRLRGQPARCVGGPAGGQPRHVGRTVTTRSASCSTPGTLSSPRPSTRSSGRIAEGLDQLSANFTDQRRA